MMDDAEAWICLDWCLLFRRGHGRIYIGYQRGGISGHHLEDRVVFNISFFDILVPPVLLRRYCPSGRMSGPLAPPLHLSLDCLHRSSTLCLPGQEMQPWIDSEPARDPGYHRRILNGNYHS
jgi:hypothetical protein